MLELSCVIERMKKYDQSCSVMPSLPFFLVIKSFYSFQKGKNSDIDVTKKAYSFDTRYTKADYDDINSLL